MKYCIVLAVMAIVAASSTPSLAQSKKGARMSEAECSALATQRGARIGRPAHRKFVNQCMKGKIPN